MTLKGLLFGATPLPLLRKGMDAYAMRQRAIADNVANAETPGFVRREVNFESKLEEALRSDSLRRTDSRHLFRTHEDMADITPELEFDRTPTDVNDLNNVDIDREMAQLSRNTTQYLYAAQMARKFFEHINSAIRGTSG